MNQTGSAKNILSGLPINAVSGLSIPGKDNYFLFGPGVYAENVEAILRSMRPALTQESISAITPSFAKNGEFDAKRDFLDGFDGTPHGLAWRVSRSLHLGYVVLTPKGVFTNTTQTDESWLNKYLTNATKVNGIYLVNHKTAFAPYESFQNWSLDNGDFVRGGLARALEHTTGPIAPNLAKISSTENYPEGVDAYSFFKTDGRFKEPTLSVVSLESGGGHSSGRLIVLNDLHQNNIGYSIGTEIFS